MTGYVGPFGGQELEKARCPNDPGHLRVLSWPPARPGGACCGEHSAPAPDHCFATICKAAPAPTAESAAVSTGEPPPQDPIGRVPQTPAFVLLCRHPEPLASPQPVHTLDVDPEALQPQHPADHPVAAARVRPHQLVRPSHDPLLPLALHRRVPLRRTRLVQHPAHTPLGLMELVLYVPHDAPPARGARCFPRYSLASFRIEMSMA